jgi:hypothetical protein
VYLNARPLDVYRSQGSPPVIGAIHAQAQQEAVG